ncbi:hypothetical protein Tco_0852029 [Tanacetum coccineum]
MICTTSIRKLVNIYDFTLTVLYALRWLPVTRRLVQLRNPRSRKILLNSDLITRQRRVHRKPLTSISTTAVKLLLMPEVAVYTCINDNLNAIVRNCAQDSPYSNKLQSLNATFPLGVLTPTTSIEASSSVAGDAITELPHTGHKVVYKHKHTYKDCRLFQDLDCVFPWNHF